MLKIKLRRIPKMAADAIAGNFAPNIGIMPSENAKLPPKPMIKIVEIIARLRESNISTFLLIIIVIPCEAIMPNK